MDDAKINISVVMIIWFFTTIILAALFIASGLQGELTTSHMVIAGIILSLALIGTPLAYFGLRDQETDTAKAKRERIDTMLRDMSDDELLELKQRLSTGDYSEDSLLDYVSDDGELVMRS